MVMEKGLSIRQAEDLVSSSAHLIDFIKLGFGTSIFTNGVEEKVKIYQEAGIKVYVGGTLFEAFLARDQFEQYKAWIEKIGCDAVEISDGSIEMDHDIKCDFIKYFADDYTVLSEVGNKDGDIIIENDKWVEMTSKELEAGAFKVIAEARESGTGGIFDKSGKADDSLIDTLAQEIPMDKIMWEAPQHSQQIYFIKKMGAEVNLGNIAPNEIIPLEALRTGLRGDTFYSFLTE